MPTYIFCRITDLTMQFIHFLVKNNELMIRNFTVYGLANLVTFVFWNLYDKQFYFLVVSNNAILIIWIRLFEVTCQCIYIVVLIFHIQKQAIGNDIGYTRVLDNRRFFTTFAHDWSNNRIVIRQLAVTSGNRSYSSIIINTRTIRSRDGINRNNAVYRRMVATAF